MEWTHKTQVETGLLACAVTRTLADTLKPVSNVAFTLRRANDRVLYLYNIARTKREEREIALEFILNKERKRERRISYNLSRDIFFFL